MHALFSRPAGCEPARPDASPRGHTALVLQRAAGNAAVAGLRTLPATTTAPLPLPGLPDAWAALGGGRPLTPEERAPYERSYGYDLAPVRLYEHGSLPVRALATGNHVLTAGPLTPYELGHELAHVVQQTERGPAPESATAKLAGSTVESDADAAAGAALTGQRYQVGPAGDEHLAAIGPLLLFALAALFGIGTALAAGMFGPSFAENRRRAAEREKDPSFRAWAETKWLHVPVGGTLSRIWGARNLTEQVVSTVALPLEVGTGQAVGTALMRIADRALWRIALNRVSAAELEAVAGAGIRPATEAELTAAARQALDAGQAVAVGMGLRGHIAVYVKVKGRTYLLDGEPWRSMRAVALRGFATKRLNAVHAMGDGTVAGPVLAEARRIAASTFGLGFTVRTCGVGAARLAEVAGRTGMRGAPSLLPINVFGRLSQQGTTLVSTAGARRILATAAGHVMLLGSADAVLKTAQWGAGELPAGVSESELDSGLSGGVAGSLTAEQVPAAYRELRAALEPTPADEVPVTFQFYAEPEKH